MEKIKTVFFLKKMYYWHVNNTQKRIYLMIVIFINMYNSKGKVKLINEVMIDNLTTSITKYMLFFLFYENFD